MEHGWTCEVEIVGRDGVRAVVRVSCSAEDEDWSMKVVGQQKVTKGILDQVRALFYMLTVVRKS